MKIVIDIPEKDYEIIKQINILIYDTEDNLSRGNLLKSIQNGTPLAKEIEDIKAKIDAKRIRKNPKNDFIDGYNLAIFDAFEIIDNR